MTVKMNIIAEHWFQSSLRWCSYTDITVSTQRRSGTLIYSGIDIVRCNHLAFVILFDSEVLDEPIRFSNDSNCFHLLLAQLDQFIQDSHIIGFEPTVSKSTHHCGIPCSSVVQCLCHQIDSHKQCEQMLSARRRQLVFFSGTCHKLASVSILLWCKEALDERKTTVLSFTAPGSMSVSSLRCPPKRLSWVDPDFFWTSLWYPVHWNSPPSFHLLWFPVSSPSRYCFLVVCFFWCYWYLAIIAFIFPKFNTILCVSSTKQLCCSLGTFTHLLL